MTHHAHGSRQYAESGGEDAVCSTRDPELLHLYSLVLSAADIPHRIVADGNDGWSMWT